MFIHLFWKTSPGKWSMIRVNVLIWLAGHTGHVEVPPSSYFGIF